MLLWRGTFGMVVSCAGHDRKTPNHHKVQAPRCIVGCRCFCSMHPLWILLVVADGVGPGSPIGDRVDFVVR